MNMELKEYEYYNKGGQIIFNGDVVSVLKCPPQDCVDCIVTSPPYWGLRDYCVAGQIGAEKTVEEYIQKLSTVFCEINRVLRNTGVLWLNLGDTYGRGKRCLWSGDATRKSGVQKHLTESGNYGGGAIAPNKQLIGVPWKVAFTLQQFGWYLRSDIIWSKPNPMPESVRDRPTRSHEYVFLLSKKQKYYYNFEAMKEPSVCMHKSGNGFARNCRESYKNKDGTPRGNVEQWKPTELRNCRDVWSINTKPFKGAHFAVFPEELATKCLLGGCQKGGIVLDPFFGSGTVGVVAKRLGMRCIGIDINKEYCEIAKERIIKVSHCEVGK